MKKYFISNDITYLYPHEISENVKEYGVLSAYMGKYYDRDEIDKIMCEMIMRHPYIENSVMLTFSVMYVYTENNVRGYYQHFCFKNDNYKQQTKGNLEIKYEK